MGDDGVDWMDVGMGVGKAFATAVGFAIALANEGLAEELFLHCVGYYPPTSEVLEPGPEG